MTLVNTETGELVEPMSEADARRLTERIRIAATNYTEAKAKVLALVDEAKEGMAHIALGYKSWTAYLSDVLSDEPLRLARDERRELVTRLADEGMSHRAIAPIVGVDHKTVGNDLTATGEFSPVDRTAPVVRTTTGLDGRERITATAGRVRQEQRPDAELILNVIEADARKAANAADKLTDAQIDRVKQKADLWTVGLRESVETLQRLLTSLESE